MSNTIKAIKGIDKIAYALIKSVGEDGTPVYDKPQRLIGAKELSFKPQYKNGEYYHDGHLAFSVNDLNFLEVSFNVTDVPEADMIKLFGHKEAQNGGYIVTATDVQPDIALLFRCALADGSYRYTVVYNGQLIPNDNQFKNADDKVEFSTKTLSGKFKPLGTDEKTLYYVIDSSNPSAPADLDTKFYENVMIATEKVVTP